MHRVSRSSEPQGDVRWVCQWNPDSSRSWAQASMRLTVACGFLPRDALRVPGKLLPLDGLLDRLAARAQTRLEEVVVDVYSDAGR